jgi:hypothetical protein
MARWLSPAMDAVRDRHEMRLVLQHWVAENHRSADPTGRWAIEHTEETRVIGGLTLLYLPPGGTDLEIGWQLAPAERIGMERIGETDKYYDLHLRVYRVRPADLDRPPADQQYGANQHRPPAQ